MTALILSAQVALPLGLLAWLTFWPAGSGLGLGVVIGRACQPDP